MTNPILTNQEKFDALFAKLQKEQGAWQAFMESPATLLEEAGIPLVQLLPPSSSAAAPAVDSEQISAAIAGIERVAKSSQMIAVESEKVSASIHWWGVDITMNEKLTQDIIAGIAGVGPLGGLVAGAFGAAGLITGGVATVIGAGFAAICALKIAEMKIIDNGNGVHWPISWAQWALLIAAVPGGPGAIVVAGLVFIHPVRN